MIESSEAVAAGTPRREVQRRVVDYYDQCADDYRILWRSDQTHSLHYGFFDDPEAAGPARWSERPVGKVLSMGGRTLAAVAGLAAYPGPPRMREWATRALRVASRSSARTSLRVRRRRMGMS